MVGYLARHGPAEQGRGRVGTCGGGKLALLALVCGVTFSTSASARQRWSARCGGATLHAWVVNPRSSTDFVLPAQTRLPEPRVVRERRPTARGAAAR